MVIILSDNCCISLCYRTYRILFQVSLFNTYPKIYGIPSQNTVTLFECKFVIPGTLTSLYLLSICSHVLFWHSDTNLIQSTPTLFFLAPFVITMFKKCWFENMCMSLYLPYMECFEERSWNDKENAWRAVVWVVYSYHDVRNTCNDSCKTAECLPLEYYWLSRSNLSLQVWFTHTCLDVYGPEIVCQIRMLQHCICPKPLLAPELSKRYTVYCRTYPYGSFIFMTYIGDPKQC